MAAVDAAVEAGLPPDAETRLRDLLLGPLMFFVASLSGDPPARVEPFQAKLKVDADLSKALFDGFCRSLSGDPPARLEPFHVKLKADSDFSKVKARSRVYSPAKTAWLEEQFAQLADAGMVYEKPQVQILPRRSRRTMAIPWLAISRLLTNRVSRWLPRQCFCSNRRR